jgi:hypothetical protein
VRGRRATGALLAIAFLLALLASVELDFGVSGAGAVGGGELIAQPSYGAPADTFLGASPQEATGEAWATATSGGTLARYTDADGWSTVSPPVTGEGLPIPELEWVRGPDAGRTTPGGGIVAAATGPSEEPLLITRDPGRALIAADEPPPTVLGAEEALFDPEGAAPLLAATEGSGGATRALLVPVVGVSSAPEAVLSYVGGHWSREPICVGLEGAPGCTAPQFGFEVRAIDAAGGEAWLLAEGAVAGEGIELFRRQGSGESVVWRQQALGPPGSLGARLAEAAAPGATVAAREGGQALTVTAAGLWVDAEIGAGGADYDATFYYDLGTKEVTGSWCDLDEPAGLCSRELGAELPDAGGRSFAWPPASGSPFGARVITGVGQGAILSLEGEVFSRLTLAGGAAGAAQGAALTAPDAGWLGASTPLHLTRNPEPSQLQAWPVAFRRPLTAIAPEPGAPVASLEAEALAVGDDGEVARYRPGGGWEPEFLLTAAGKRATPTLRGVAWPQPKRAYAVGDGAAIWLWNGETKFWEPDPALSPNLTRANFTGIAFAPDDPTRGYAIGKQGLLLAYGRTWTREALPSAVPAEANLTSIAFAGREAMITWKYPLLRNGNVVYEGGVIDNDGSGWEVDAGASAALEAAVPQRVAGLADGGAVIATAEGPSETGVIERQGESAAWERAAGGAVGYPAALAAIREGGQVRAVISVAKGQTDRDLGTDQEQAFNQLAASQPPLLTDPYPLPGAGLLLRQTATGWRDEQHQAYPLPHPDGQESYDLPLRPDPVLALLVSGDGSQGWAVGGETGTFVRFQGEAVQTAGVMRYGGAAAPPSNASAVAIPPTAGSAQFAIGGGAQCAGPCADLAGTGIGPDRWLRAAIAGANGIPEVRAFLYTGTGVAAGVGTTLSPSAFAREEEAYATRLASAGRPVFAAPSQSDLDSSDSLATFAGAFAGFQQPFGAALPGAGIEPVSPTAVGRAYYSFTSQGNGGAVRVIVLDYSAADLGQSQRCWLAGQLRAAGSAGTPAIVIGQRDLAGQVPSGRATDAAATLPVLVRGAWPAECGSPPSGEQWGASAYFFDFPEQDRQYSLNAGGRSIPAFGSGTLGYVNPPKKRETDFVGASGFLLAAVNVAARNPATNVAPVGVRLIPNIGSLALDAADGTLLRRSQPALFEALARRPLGGGECTGAAAPLGCEIMNPDPYLQIPSECQGPKCATATFPEYSFTSSRPDIAAFVAHDPASPNPRNVLLVNEKPVLDSSSGLLCAFNAGTTTVTVSAGGLAYSTTVTVLPGSVQRPCGTTPLLGRSTASPSPTPVAPPAPAPLPPSPAPAPLPPPPPPPAAAPPAPAPLPLPTPLPAPATPTAAPPPFFAPPAPAVPLVPVVPPPPAPTFPVTPPSGTSPVSATQEDEEEETAFDTVQSMTALRPDPPRAPSLGAGGGGGVPALLPVLALLAALGIAAGTLTVYRRDARRPLAYQANSRRYR